MPVTYLELENFKSYAGVQRIGPFRDFTSVIGPNGSGKSNLMDAISFILGVQSKDLRSQQLKDLIFRPPGSIQDDSNDEMSDDEDDGNPKLSSLKASAALIYLDPETNEETRFSRTISAKGVGEYRINNKAVPFAQYEKVLASIGVLLKGRNFLVFQGDVESTARKTPKELVTWFEDISGSAQFIEEYNEAKTQMQEAEANALAASQKQKGISKKKRELKGQKDEAEKFKSLVDSKAKLVTDYFLWQLFHIRADIEEKEESLEELNDELTEKGEELETRAESVRAAKKEASTTRSKVAKLEKKRVALAAQVDQVQPDIIQTSGVVKNLEKRISAEGKKKENIAREAQTREETLATLEKDIREYTETEQQLEREYDETKSQSQGGGEVSLTEEQEQEYEQIREAAAIASAKPRQALHAANRKLEHVRAKTASVSEEHKELLSNQTDAKHRIRDLIERRDKLEDSIAKTKKDLNQSKKDLTSVQKQIQDDQVKREAIDKELEQIHGKLRYMKDDQRQNQHEMRVEEAIASLKRFFPGVKGRLAKLCEPSMKRYDLAVTVAGGKDMDAVVVDTKKTAFECIDYLRSHRIGSATFIPLDSIKVPDPASTERLRATISQDRDSRYRLAYDVITCADESVRKAIMYSVGNTVVCEDLDCARELCFERSGGRRRGGEGGREERIKAVTLGGAVISKAGTMTGGVTQEDRSKAGRWSDREMEKLRKRKTELDGQLEQIDLAERGVDSSSSQTDRRGSRGGRTSKIEELRNSVGNLTNRLKYSESDLSFTKKKLKETETLEKSITSQVRKVSNNLEDLEAEIISIQGNVKNAIEEVKDAEEEHYGPFREKTGMTDFRAYDEALGKAREDFLKKRRAIREHLEKLKAQKKYEDERDFEKIMAKKLETLENLEKKLAVAKTHEKESMEAIADSKAKLANIVSELEGMREIEKQHEEGVGMAQSGYKECQKENSKLSKRINTEEANLERLRAKLHETLQKARVEEAEVPILDADADDNSDSADASSQTSRRTRRSRTDEESQESSGPFTQGTQGSMHFSQQDDSRVMRDRNDANRVDFSGLRPHLKQRLSDRKEKELIKRFEDEMERLTAQIESMTPNMKAGDAFDAVVNQLAECQEDFAVARDKSKKATKYFDEIKNRRSEAFTTAFKHIAQALTTIYKDMTKSSKHPLGGNAYLSLDDSEEPYNGGIKFTAMPPMKRYRDMEYLSGGEKTIAALALLFAIHSYHPAPFFVMDEVDAALDNINVLKLCNYIRQRSKDFQCIVISLKDMFYEQSQGLVGICRNVATNSSRTLTLDLTQFDKEEDDLVTRGDRKRRRSSSVGPRKRSSTSTDNSQ